MEKSCLSPNVGPNVASSENVAPNNAAPKCGFKHKCGGASKMMEMWRQTMRRQNVASSTNVVAPPKMTEMWRQTVKQCGVRHKCGGSPKCGVKQCGVRHKCGGSPKCGVKMWRRTPPLPNCLPGNVSSKKVFSGRHKSATLNACALN